MGNKPLKYFITSVLLLLLLGLYEGKLPVPLQGFIAEHYKESSQTTNDTAVVLTEKRAQHILYGDGESGGHKHGVGTPCKSEFPEDWDDEKIIRVTKKIAANDNLPWEQQDNGYYVSEYLDDGVKVRVVLGEQKQRVITSYPTNVTRNPCPANDD
ncbi:MAG: EndoU domain-containing protein [Alphaproteobacteria bacterium]